MLADPDRIHLPFPRTDTVQAALAAANRSTFHQTPFYRARGSTFENWLSTIHAGRASHPPQPANPDHLRLIHWNIEKGKAWDRLTQVTRSPVVRKSSEPGVYEVDRQAPLRIRQRLERLQAKLREVTLSQAPVDLATVRARRHELDLAISQQERALEEALRVLRRDVVAAAGHALGT